MIRNLESQTAVISGGLGDIGRAIAMELARRGANIALSDIHPPEDAAAVLKSITAVNVRARYDRVDVSQPAEIDGWLAGVEQELGPATLVIPNAAIVNFGSVLTPLPEQWTRELQVNLSGAFFMAQAAAKRLIAQQLPGRIVFVGSWAAHAPHPQIIAYCASKAGLRMVCKCMALELAPHHILVNEVAPGYVDAGLTGQAFAKNPPSREAAQGRVPIGQLITADQVARNVAFLCDPENQQMTGSVLLMDGGLSLVTPAKK